MFNILVVDDDVNTNKLMSAVLKSDNYTVYSAKNGFEALEILQNKSVDIIVLDIMMPEMDGYELTKILREKGSEIPILMVTAKQMREDLKQGFIVGIDDYMTKPVDEEEMLLRIKALLRRSKIVSEQKLTVGNVVLDYNNLSVIYNGQNIILPKKEFLVLFKLLSYPDKIFTREELMEDIWGPDSESDDHTLNVHINRLRDRFAGCKDFDIITIRGLGYKAVKSNVKE